MEQDKKKLTPGARVRFLGRRLHDAEPRFYPAVGTIGEIKFRWQSSNRWFVQWPAGTTMGEGLWSAPGDALEAVENE